MNTLKKYCIENINSLIIHEQKSFCWKQNYNLESLLKIHGFSEIYTRIPDKINRLQIIDSIQKKKFYQAYAEILFWGLIGMRPGSNKSKRTEIAIKALSHPKNKIEDIFQTVYEGDKDKIKSVYKSLENGGTNKISEVGVSYFTKVLAFASEASEEQFKLLIYDKWTKLVHVHLLLDCDQKDRLTLFYSPSTLSKLWFKKEKAKSYSTDIISNLSNKGFDSYMDYCVKMNALAKEIFDETKKEIKVFQLESFLFGHELRGIGKNIQNNPRYWIQQNYAKQYAPLIASL
jgi:hypothetical protein